MMPTVSTPRLRARRLVAALGALTVAAIGLMPAASAGPDDGRPIATAGHIDSPQISYQDGNLVLNSKGDVTGTKEYINPLDSHVIYSGTGFNGQNGSQQYMFTVPNDPAFEFLGGEGRTWYMAPQLPVGNHEPIWIGFGADAKIPAEKFRDEVVYLDLIGVKGPGRVEALGFHRSGESWVVNRMFSSVDPVYRSLVVFPGDHTHNATLFSRPGRYELTYQASARLKDGTIVRSKPTVQTWHVGGAKPAEKATPSLADAFAAAPEGTPATPYSFTASPTEGELTGREDGRLTTFRFDAKDANVNGRLTLTLQGFHFTDIPVKGGKAEAKYYAGAFDSTLQATFIPDGKAGVRWRSEPLAFDAKARTIATTSEKSGDAFQEALPEKSPKLDFAKHTLTDKSYTFTFTPLGKNRYRATLEFGDKAVRAFMSGGIFEPGDDEYPWEVLDTMVGEGRGEKVIESSSSTPGQFVRVDVKPHASMDFESFSFRLPKDLPLTEPVVVKGTIGEKPVDPTPSPEPTETPDPTPTGPTWQTCVGDKAALTKGHVDISATLKDGKLSSFLRDDTAEVDKDSVNRDLDKTALIVTDAARYTRPRELEGKDYDFLGPLGSTVYLLPAEQKAGVIWPGWNTQGVDYKALNGPVELKLASFSGPGDLRIAIPGGPGKPPSVVLDSATHTKAISVDFATHVHAAWVFTKPGVYRLGLQFAATAKNGEKLASPVRELTVVVGSQTTCDTPESPAPSESASTPDPSVAPGGDSGQGGAGAAPSAGPAEGSRREASLPVTGAELMVAPALALLAGGTVLLAMRRRHLLG